MYAQGGTSLASKDDYLQASFATNTSGLSGLGGIKALDLDKMLAASSRPRRRSFRLATHGSGSAAPAELETRSNCSTGFHRIRATIRTRSR